MTVSTTCPPVNRLREMLDGKLKEAEQNDLAAHLESCAACQRTIDGLAAGRDTWEATTEKLREAPPQPTPALQQVMDELRAGALSAATHIGAAPETELPSGFLDPPDQPEHLGKLDHYEVLEVVGRGAFGTVLRGFDQKLHRVVAIKVMSPQLASSATARKRFIREGQAAAAVCHEHVVTIHAVEETRSIPYLVMQFIQGVSLQERIDRKGPPALNGILRIGMQAAAGLAAAHAQGLVHRDITPSNILLENGVERVKITDFGLARAVDDASLTQTGVIAGTPQYMAPEQARGDAVDHRADLFSLGSVLYALCTGRPPFRASTTMAVLKRVCEEAPRPIREINPEIPEWLAAIIGRLHAKNPDERFQSAAEVSELLGRYLAHVQQPDRFPIPAPQAVASSSSADNGVSLRIEPAAAAGLGAPPARHRALPKVFEFEANSKRVIGLLLVLLGIPLAGWSLQSLNLVAIDTAEMIGVGGFAMAWMVQLAMLTVACLQRVRNRTWAGGVLGSYPLITAAVFILLDIVVARAVTGQWRWNAQSTSRSATVGGDHLVTIAPTAHPPASRPSMSGIPVAATGQGLLHPVAEGDVNVNPAAVNRPRSIAGTWSSDWGDVTFEHAETVDGKPIPVKGNYVTISQGFQGEIEGTFDPVTGVIDATWREPGPGFSGTARYVLSEDGKTLTGAYRFASDPPDFGRPWNMTRKSPASSDEAR